MKKQTKLEKGFHRASYAVKELDVCSSEKALMRFSVSSVMLAVISTETSAVALIFCFDGSPELFSS